jgi:hypothetical protein
MLSDPEVEAEALAVAATAIVEEAEALFAVASELDF